MKSENILQIVQPPFGDGWIQVVDADAEIIVHERLTAFALMVDDTGNRRWATLTVDDSGQLHEVAHGTLIFSPTQPDSIISERQKRKWGIAG